MDSCDWSNGIRYHIFVTRPDTELKLRADEKVERTGVTSSGNKAYAVKLS